MTYAKMQKEKKTYSYVILISNLMLVLAVTSVYDTYTRIPLISPHRIAPYGTEF